MSGAAILQAIARAGEAEAAQTRAEAEARAAQILAEAERAAREARAAAARHAAQPAEAARARLLHRARLEALRLRSEVREALIDEALAEARRRLDEQRAAPGYARVLRRLAREALLALNDEAQRDPPPVLEVDPRDEALARAALREEGLDLRVEARLRCAGGAIARSGDGRITADNTLEMRFERALPFLRQDLRALVEERLRGDALVSATARE